MRRRTRLTAWSPPLVSTRVARPRVGAMLCTRFGSLISRQIELARATARRAEADHRIAPATAGTIRQVLDEADWDAMAGIVAGI